MPTPQTRRAKKRAARRRNPKRYGFRRVCIFLLALVATELAWRTGAFAHTSHVHARTVAAGHHRVSQALTVHPAARLVTGSPLAPPTTAPQEAQTALDRMISLGYPVCRGAGTKPLVALTFDDGPGPYTQQTVDTLKAAGARATFFIVAKELVGWPQLADEPAVEATVGALGDHTYDHIGLVGLTQANLDHEMGDAQALIEQHDGGAQVKLFRPPYGQHDSAVDAEARGLGMLEVLWTVDSGDGLAGATASTVLQNVESHLAPGAIVLMHENRGTTQRILPDLLNYIRSKGLKTVTVPELMAEDPPSIGQLKAQHCG